MNHFISDYSDFDFSTSYKCRVCPYETASPTVAELGAARGNTSRFRDEQFRIWQCPKCHTIHAVEPVNFRDIYSDYPLNQRRLDIFAKGTLANLLRRLKKAGLKKQDTILDYGCGNGIMVQFLKNKGFSRVSGFDPYVEEYSEEPHTTFDWVIANDVIEHCPDPRQMISLCLQKVRPGGLIYVGTADANGVSMTDLEPHIMRLHLPFHRVILTEASLHALVREFPLHLVSSYTRSYMDTLLPFVSYRFLDEFSKTLDHVMEHALDPASGRIVLMKPQLIFYGLFGYFFPSAHEPAVILQRSAE